MRAFTELCRSILAWREGPHSIDSDSNSSSHLSLGALAEAATTPITADRLSLPPFQFKRPKIMSVGEGALGAFHVAQPCPTRACNMQPDRNPVKYAAPPGAGAHSGVADEEEEDEDELDGCDSDGRPRRSAVAPRARSHPAA